MTHGWEPKGCAVCGVEFLPKSRSHKFCGAQCKGKWQYVTGQYSTENQYAAISGSWRRYLARLLYVSGRKREHLTLDMLLNKVQDQEYRCALSGVPMTCNLQKGIRFHTNASVDRIVAGGPYTEDNIQLVCKAVNSWRASLSVAEFVDWCRKVVNHYEHTTHVERG